MSEIDEGEVRALAHAFARTLGHLREFQDLRYVSAAAIPGLDGDGAQDDEAQEDEVDMSAALATDPPNRPEPEPSPPPASRSEPARAEHRPAEQSTYSREQSQLSAPVNRDSAERPGSPTPAAKPRHDGPRDAGRDANAERWPAAKKLSVLRERHVADCQGCRLAETRNSIVFGVGDPEADLMFIGEAPGAEEDRLSEPFVGAAGQRLDRWIEHVGLDRRRVYIANVLKCRPPNNRDPQPDEVESCSKFLRAQIRAIQPKVLIALGRFAGNFLVPGDHKLYELRGKVHRYREPRTRVEIPVVVTYHPSYVLRSEKQPPRSGTDPRRPDHDGAIKSEDEKVLADIARAISLVRGRG